MSEYSVAPYSTSDTHSVLHGMATCSVTVRAKRKSTHVVYQPKRTDSQQAPVPHNNVLLMPTSTIDVLKRFRYASETFRNDRNVVLAGVAQDGHALQYASETLRNDDKVVLAAVAQNGYALEYASETLRNDRNVVLAAVAQNGYALQHASETLRNDREFVLTAVAHDGFALKCASETLRNDRKVVLTAVAQDGWALQYASNTLRKKHRIVTTAVNEDRTAMLKSAYPYDARYMRAGPTQTRLLFKYMPIPFSLPEEVVAMHILPKCHRR